MVGLAIVVSTLAVTAAHGACPVGAKRIVRRHFAISGSNRWLVSTTARASSPPPGGAFQQLSLDGRLYRVPMRQPAPILGNFAQETA